MQPVESDHGYYLRRAREESRRALTASKPEIAAAHYGLSIQYSARARTARTQAAQQERMAG